MKSTVILLEGSDCSGKTVLANKLLEDLKCNYIHSSVYPDFYKAHQTVKSICTMMCWGDEGLSSNVIVDRWMFSHLVYQPIFHKKADYDVRGFYYEVLDSFKKKNIDFKTIFCIPPKAQVLSKFEERRKAGGEEYNTVEEVYNKYREVSQYDWIKNKFIYDWTKDPKSIQLFKNLGIQR